MQTDVLAYLLCALAFVVVAQALRQRRHRRALSDAEGFPGYYRLDTDERRLLVQFLTLPHTSLWEDTLWQNAVRLACEGRDSSAEKFRQLERELLHAAGDNEDIIIDAIGLESYELLLRIGRKPHLTTLHNDSDIHPEWALSSKN